MKLLDVPVYSHKRPLNMLIINAWVIILQRAGNCKYSTTELNGVCILGMQRILTTYCFLEVARCSKDILKLWYVPIYFCQSIQALADYYVIRYFWSNIYQIIAALNYVEVNVFLLIVFLFGVGYTVGYSFIIATKVKSHELDRFVCFACL